MQLNPHFFDLLSEFNAARVRYLVVGAHVLNYYGRPRTTGDLDRALFCNGLEEPPPSAI